MCLWQRLRSLEDCYLLSNSDGRTYVSATSQGYRQITEGLLKEIRAGVPRELRRDIPLDRLVSRISGADVDDLARQRESVRGIPPQTKTIELDERDDDVLNTSSAEPVPSSFSPAAVTGLPVGSGFWELSKSDGETVDSRQEQGNDSDQEHATRVRHSLATPVTASPISFLLDRNQLTKVPKLKLATCFRGGWESRNIDVLTPGEGLEIIYPKPAYTTPQITVRGDSKKPVLIVFILDCSASMDETIGNETQGLSSKKMVLAREALKRILGNLMDFQKKTNGNYHVGLILYGHRCWRKESGAERDQEGTEAQGRGHLEGKSE